MRTPKLLITDVRLGLTLLFVGVLILSACSINVKKDEAGQDKKVDINTPVGGLHVSKNADVRDTGLSVYPGAHLKQNEDNGEGKSANVNISTDWFGLKVVAIEYESSDSPDKVIGYYKNELKKYGDVLECRTNSFHSNIHPRHGKDQDGTKPVTCDEDHGGNVVELKVGTEDNQHLVAVKPDGKGSSFALVYVKTRSDETI